MSDLSDVQATDGVRIIGATNTGLETTPVASDILGNLNVNQPSLISINNSTSSSFIANQVFTGTSDDVSQYASIAVQIFTNQISAVNGFKAQYSVDNINWDDGDSYNIPANDGKFFVFPPESQYFRLMYTNGANAATVRLQTILHRNIIRSTSHKIDDTLSGENDADLVKAINSAKRLDNTYDNMKLSNINELMSADIINTSFISGAINATTSAVEAKVGGSALVNRKFITITPTNGDIYYGASGVTTSSGTKIPLGRSVTLSFSALVPVFIIAATTVDVRIGEGS